MADENEKDLNEQETKEKEKKEKETKEKEKKQQNLMFEIAQPVVYDLRAEPKVFTFSIPAPQPNAEENVASKENMASKKKKTNKKKEDIEKTWTAAFKAYNEAKRAKEIKYNLNATDKNWQILRNREDAIEKLYQQNLKNFKKDADKQKENKKKSIEKQILRLKQSYEGAKNRRIESIPARALERFPKPKLGVRFLGEGEPTPVNDRNNRTISFTKFQLDNLQAIRENKRKFLFFTLDQSPEFTALQNSIESFSNDFGQLDSFGDDRDAAIKKATDMIRALAEIKMKADAYVEKYKDTNYSTACNTRKEMARKAAKMAENKIIQLVQAVEYYDRAYAKNQKEREDFSAAEQQAAETEYTDNVSAAETRKKEELEAGLQHIDLQLDAYLEDTQRKKDTAMGELELERKKLKRELSKINTIVANNAFELGTEKNGCNDYSTAPEKYQTIISELQMAKILFAEENNPFADMNADPFVVDGKHQTVYDFNKAIYGDPNRADQINYNDLTKLLAEKAPGMKLAYSANAMLTLSNLQIFDSITHMTRKPGDYNAVISFVKDGVSIPVPNILEADFARMQKEGYSCVIKNVKAEPIFEADGKLFDFKKAGKIVMPVNIVPKETLYNIMSLEKSSLNLSLPNRVTGSPDSPVSFLTSVLPSLRKDVLKKTSVRRGRRSDDSLNIFSEKKLAAQFAAGVVNYQRLDTIPEVKEVERDDDERDEYEREEYERDEYEREEDERGENEREADAPEAKKPNESMFSPTYFDQNTVKNILAVFPRKKSYIPSEMKAVVEGRKIENFLVIGSAKFYTPGMEKLLAGEHDDPQLKKIAAEISKLRTYGADTLYKHETKYLTLNGLSDVQPAPGEIYNTFRSGTNLYEDLANSIYKEIGDYLENHEDDLDDPDSPAALLEQWRGEAFPQGTLDPDKYEEVAIVINAAASSNINCESEFDGDTEYLVAMSMNQEATNPFPGYDSAQDPLEQGGRVIKLKDYSKEPLFTKAPSKEDLRQGIISNKPLFTALSNIAITNPQQIYDMITDNEDGTVTCKFYNKDKTPVCVTVSKKLAVNEYSNGDHTNLPATPTSGQETPLWVQLVEKAYALSSVCEDYANVNRNAFSYEYEDSYKACLVTQMCDNALNADPNADEDEVLEAAKRYVRENRTLLFCRSRFIAEQMDPLDIQMTLTGEKVRSKTINTMDGSELFAALQYDVESNVIDADTFNLYKISAIDQNERTDSLLPGQIILAEASKRLRALSSENQVDKNQPYGPFYLEDLTDCIHSVVRDRAGALKGYLQSDLDIAANYLCEKFVEFNMHDLRPGTHLVSKRAGNYSDYANKTFDLIERRRRRGDQVSFTTMYSKGTTYAIEACKTRGDMVKVLYLRDPSRQNDPDGGIIEMELNAFMQQAKQLSFEVSKAPLQRKEAEKEVARGILQLARKKDAEFFTKKIDPILTEDEKIAAIMELPVVGQLADKVMDHAEYMEQVQDGEDITAALGQIDQENLDVIRDTLRKEAAAVNSGLRKLAQEKKFVMDILKNAEDMKKALDAGTLKGEEATEARKWLHDSEKELKALKIKAKYFESSRTITLETQKTDLRMTLSDKIRREQSKQDHEELAVKLKLQGNGFYVEKEGDEEKKYSPDYDSAVIRKRVETRAKNGKFKDFLIKQSKSIGRKLTLSEINKLFDEHGSEYDLSDFRLPTKRKPALKPGQSKIQTPEKMAELEKEEKEIEWSGIIK